uniref:Uncharacterized protein n=1 Tax=Arundo donax TaxID=35708 RepID=A0A0A8Y8L8_ARUDO
MRSPTLNPAGKRREEVRIRRRWPLQSLSELLGSWNGLERARQWRIAAVAAAVQQEK